MILCISAHFKTMRQSSSITKNCLAPHIRRRLCLALLLIAPFLLPAQPIDSLLQVLASEKTDTQRVNLFNELAWELKFDAPDSARAFLDSALNLAKRTGFKKGEGDALNYRGVIEDIHGRPDSTIYYFHKALDIRRSLGDSAGVASLYNNLGNVEEYRGEYIRALNYYQNSLRIREELGDSLRMARLYYNISILYESMGLYSEALDNIFKYLELIPLLPHEEEDLANAYIVIGNIKMELDRFSEAKNYYLKALRIYRKANSSRELADALNNLGNAEDAQADSLYETQHLPEALALSLQALERYREALQIRRQLEDEEGAAELYNNMGLTYKNLGSYLMKAGEKEEAFAKWDTALLLFRPALNTWAAYDNKKGIMMVCNGLGDVHRRQGQLDSALYYVQQYLNIAKEIEDPKFQQNAYKDLGRIYYLRGEYKKAYDYRRKYDQLKYQRLSEKKIRDNERREILYGDRLKQYEIERQKQELQLQQERARRMFITFIGGALILLLIIGLLVNRYRMKVRTNRQLAEKNAIIERERQRSEKLLLNILPEEVAQELKETGRTRARSYEEVTVLFTDFKSFTTVAEQLSPEELVAMLDECFSAFDEITENLGIEKIKTIGDAYMCAAGLPEPIPDHAKRAVQAGLAMRDFMLAFAERQKKQNLPAFEIRIGIHTGPVVAGVVGHKKFAYDIWGDAVNLAARMESSGQAGKVNISHSTWLLVKDHFNCTYRGEVEAKNKGRQKMYFVEG